jgi:hypothetical protein
MLELADLPLLARAPRLAADPHRCAGRIQPRSRGVKPTSLSKQMSRSVPLRLRAQQAIPAGFAFAGPRIRAERLREADSTMVTHYAPIPSGWAVLAGSVLFVAGVVNVILGVVTLVNPNASTVAAQGQIVWGLATWGWIQVILGVVQGVLSFGLFLVQGWHRGRGSSAPG